MGYPVFLHIDIVDTKEPERGACLVRVKGNLIAEPRVGGHLTVLSAGNNYHLTFKNVDEVIESSVLEVYCEDVVPQQASAEEVANSLEEFFAKNGWVVCDDGGNVQEDFYA